MRKLLIELQQEVNHEQYMRQTVGMYEQDEHPVHRFYDARWWCWLVVIDAYLGWWFRRIDCMVLGHKLADLDPGDPEVGPMPDVVCTHCDRGFSS